MAVKRVVSGPRIGVALAVLLVACADDGGGTLGSAGSGAMIVPTAGMGGMAAAVAAPTGGMVAQPASGAGGTAGGNAGSQAPAGAGGSAGQAGAAGGPAPMFPDAWPQMGYDERNHYHNPSERTLSVANAPMLQLKWTFQVTGFPPGSPAIAEGKVFVLATGGLYAIDLQSGTELWHRAELAGTASVAYADGAIYVHTQQADLYKLNAQDGTTLWGPIRTYDNEVADGTSSPIVAGGKVMVGHSAEAAEIDFTGMLMAAQMAARGGVFAADTATGQMAWRYYTVPGSPGENGAMVWSSVAVDVEAGAVYATTGNNWNVGGPNSDAFHAIDLATGTRLWAKQVRAGDLWNIMLPPSGSQILDTDFGANPIVAEVGGRKLVAGGDKGSAFWALDPATGEIVWSQEQLSSSYGPATGGVLNNGAFDGQYFYAVSNQPPDASVLHALDPARDGADVWPAKTYPLITWGMPTVANGVLVVPINQELHVLDAATGAELRMFDTGGSIAAGGAAIAQGKIVVASGLQYTFAGPSALNNNEVQCYGLP